MSNPTVKEIVRDYLVANGCGGLYSGDGDCECEVADLFPCGSGGIEGCHAGYRLSCTCGEHDWHIGEAKKSMSDRELIEDQEVKP